MPPTNPNEKWTYTLAKPIAQGLCGHWHHVDCVDDTRTRTIQGKSVAKPCSYHTCREPWITERVMEHVPQLEGQSSSVQFHYSR